MAENQVTGGGGGAYPLPDLSNIVTPEEAAAKLNEIDAAWVTDNQHPYTNSGHVQHANWQEAVNKLYRVKFQDADPRTPLQRAMAEGMERQGQDQADRVQRGQDLMAELESEGFERADVPDDLSEAEVLGLQAQLWAARGQYDEVDRLTKTALEQLPGLPSDVRDLCNDFKDADEDDKPDYVEAIARELVKEWHRKTGFTRRPKGNAND